MVLTGLVNKRGQAIMDPKAAALSASPVKMTT
jgi:hypothetical protein